MDLPSLLTLSSDGVFFHIKEFVRILSSRCNLFSFSFCYTNYIRGVLLSFASAMHIVKPLDIGKGGLSMKKFFYRSAVAAALATFLSLGTPLAFAAEAPAVLLNGETSPIHAEKIDDTLYFSLRDYWVNVQGAAPEDIKWYGDTKTVSCHNQNFVFLNDQSYRNATSQSGKLTTPAILKDGRVMVSASYLSDCQDTRWYQVTELEDTLIFRKTTWALADAPLSESFRPAPIPVDAKTGLPALESCSLLKGKHFSNDDFTITQKETADGKTLFTYTSKADSSKTLEITAVDDYVTYVLDNNAVFSSQPR